MPFLILLGIVSIIGFVSYKVILKKMNETSKKIYEDSLKDFDKYANQLKELNQKIQSLEMIGIKKYADDYVWKEFKSSFLLKLGVISPFFISMGLFISKVTLSYYLIPLLVSIGCFTLAFVLYRVIKTYDIAKEGSNEFLFLLTSYKKDYVLVEYNKINSAFNVLQTQTSYVSDAKLLLRNFNKSYLDVIDVINKQSVIQDDVKTLMLEKIDDAFKEGMDILKEIHDILLAEDKVDANMKSDLIVEKSNQNIKNLENLFKVMVNINESLVVTVLDIPKITSHQSTIDDANDSLKALQESMEQAKVVQETIKSFSFNKYKQ